MYKVKKLLAVLLTVVLSISLLPVSVFANDSPTPEYSLVLQAEMLGTPVTVVNKDSTFRVSLYLKGPPNTAVPAAGQIKFTTSGASFLESNWIVPLETTKSESTTTRPSQDDDTLVEHLITWYGANKTFDENGTALVAYNDGFIMRSEDVTLLITEAILSESGSPSENETKPTVPDPVVVKSNIYETNELTIVTNGKGKVTYCGQHKFEDSEGGYLYYWAEPEEGYYVSSVSLTVNGSNMTPRAGGGCGGYFRLDNLSEATELIVTFSQFTSIISIGTSTELASFNDEVKNGKTFEGVLVKLTADIDMGNTGDWTPVGTSGSPFKGTFDGDSHVISGLSIASSGSNTGFFGRCEGAQILNLSVSGKATSSTFYMGGVSASSRYTRITNCKNHVSFDASDVESVIGGITGDVTFCVVSDCSNYGEINGNNTQGGIIGRCIFGYYNEISRCINEGNVTGVETGGICGTATDLKISECANKGKISAASDTSSCAGGILASITSGIKPVEITSCYNTGTVSVSTASTKRSNEPAIGGIFSQVGSGSILIDNCWNTGALTKSESHETRYGEIAPLKDLKSTGTTGGGEQIEIIDAVGITMTDCYTSNDVISIDKLNMTHQGVWATDDKGSIILWWEDTTISEIPRKVTFSITPNNIESVICVYSDENMSEETLLYPDTDVYMLQAGTYYYKIAAEGFVTELGSFIVNGADITVTKNLSAASTITFDTKPSDSQITVTRNGSIITPVSKETPNVYELYTGVSYSYSVTASGYNSVSRDFTVNGDQTIEVSLTISGQGQVSADRVIRPDNVPYTISEGGTYDLASGDFGTNGFVYLDTTEPVTIIGSGVASSNMSEDLFIVSRKDGVDLTLQDVYISNSLGKANMIDFQGKGNTLNFSGTSILDQNTGASGYAMIHVPDSAELTVTGSTLYMYKREQGAGIGGNGGATGGGQEAETNGIITIRDATIFAKNSKQGALIGAGAQAGSQKPGSISIENSTLYLLAISRGAAIGGSAGGNGASSGSNVSVKDSQITINMDYSGAAIGGGGHADGNDSDGGTLVYDSGSIRTFIDYNAVAENLWTGITEAGVNGNAAITADIQDVKGNPLYLLELDTKEIGGDTFRVREGNRTVYSGGLHQYAYINEALHKENQITVNSTIDNWTALDDSNLYLYLTGEDHTLNVNGVTVNAVWDEKTETFTVKVKKPETGEVSESTEWNGVDVDVSWYIGHEDDSSYQIDTAAKLAGAAALVNGLVNEDSHVYISKTQYYPASWWNSLESGYVYGSDEEERAGSQNKATAAYHYGIDSFKGKTIVLTKDLDMGGSQDEDGEWSGPAYMPIGGQYLMTKNDETTKLSSSFCGTFDGGGHYVRNIYCDRHCETGNYGDGQSVGFIGRLGVHDNDSEDLRPANPTVKDLAVSGYIYGNRSVGGIVGKTGKTTASSGDGSDGSIISGCVNYATVKNTDAKGCGGIVGAFWNGGRMENCYNAGEVSTTYSCPTAGLAGSNENTIVNSYNIGMISAPNGNYAMAIGTNNGGAPMKVITNCWYLDGSAPGGGYFSSSKANNDGAMTAEAMKETSFVAQLGRAFNADSDHINNGYPILKWQGGTPVEEPQPQEVDKNALNEAITAAQADQAATTVSTDGSDVDPEEQWVDAEAAKTLEDAIAAAQAVAEDDSASQEQVDAAAEALKAAQEAFDQAKKAGRKPVDHETVCPSKAFTDLDTGKWYHEAIDYVLVQQYFKGMSETSFAPDGTMTRAMFVTVLSRLEGIDTSQFSGTSFTDVAEGQWYTAAIEWASQNDIVLGVGGGQFDPDGQVTREQMAAILFRYANYKKVETSGGDTAKFDTFTDKGSVSDWAKEPMIWATGNGLINGMGNGTLAPQKTATRAQVAQIIKNFDQKIG